MILNLNEKNMALGCKYCIKGEKLVLYITGLCEESCYYCPLSENRKGKDVIYANERKINSVEEAILESKLCGSKGVGITGGNPLLRIERTAKYLKALKNEFGSNFHAHLYTTPTFINENNLKILKDANLDEIRLHPSKLFENCKEFKEFNTKEFLEKLILCKKYINDVGIEIPGIPKFEEEILKLASDVEKIGVNFLNINELEYSETNYLLLKERKFKEKDDVSSGILGSEKTALNVLKKFKGNLKIHYCPSSLKDGVQMKNRLINRAKNVAKPYEIITEEGLLIKGIILFKKIEDISNIIETLEKNNENFEILDEKIYLNSKALENLIENLKKENFKFNFSAYISEYYPTSDKLEVERIPLVTKKPNIKLKKK
ncbi:Radical SAM domain protein [Methanococcus vannielii SB]|uniref:Radical SAM domain protein n=1 Tax=Methanococcus vannielii (strain ATCC 35089 / DSM 1224 / JCM 13029 / OCM 148 / SB) TaxID=406327 RepID=A6UPJ3_METVS|nr:radical SAM protein [Methanococcus vannielii]ABR54415.1 Radical SAM domain protein [Methanococcus vannielii SB]